jgi:hypothetical protein
LAFEQAGELAVLRDPVWHFHDSAALPMVTVTAHLMASTTPVCRSWALLNRMMAGRS